MQNILNIAKREFRSYFNGPTAYIVLSIVLLALGFFFWRLFFLIERASVREMFVWLGRLSTFAAPALAMGLIADEKRQGTIELLSTLPIKDHEVVVGKFLGVLGLFGVLLLLTFPYPIAAAQFGPLDWGPVFTGYLGMLFMGAAMLSIGVMASSFTHSQVTAFFIAFAITFGLWLINEMVSLLGGAAEYLQWLSFGYHFEGLARGVIDMRDLVYFLSVTALCLSITVRSLESRRWS